jgi:uncharacterized protein
LVVRRALHTAQGAAWQFAAPHNGHDFCAIFPVFGRAGARMRALLGAKRRESHPSRFAFSSRETAMNRFAPLVRQPRALAAATALTLAFLAADARSAAVQCATASKPAEFAICNSETLQALDARVDSAYRQQYAAASVLKSREIVGAQAQWQRGVEECRIDMSCIERRMRERLDDLATPAKVAAKAAAKAEPKFETRVVAKAETLVETKIAAKAPAKPAAKPVAEFRRFAEAEAGN